MVLFRIDYTPSVPWVPTRDEVIDYLVKLIQPYQGDIVYDVGCGDGKVAIRIAKKHPHAYVKCIEIRDDLIEKAKSNALSNSVKIDIIKADFFQFNFSDANIVYMYLLTSVNQKLKPKLERELRPGTIVVTLDFPVPGWSPVAEIELPRSWQRVLYVYIIGYSDREGLNVDVDALTRGLSRLNISAIPDVLRTRIEGLLELTKKSKS
jgi:SAM-dependent methyltransferase